MTIDLALLKRVNDQVNHAHRWGDPCPADTGDGVYDCENFAYDKRALLLEAGVLPCQMRVTVVRLPDSELHAILVVYPDDGPPLALDSIISNVAPLSDLTDFQHYVVLPGPVPDPYTGRIDWAHVLGLESQKR